VRGQEISVIIPALNEQESIGYVVAAMPWPMIAECIVVDNGSSDETGRIAAAAGARVVTSPRGYGAACKAGSDAANAGSTILVFMDGDGSDIIADLPRLVKILREANYHGYLALEYESAEDPYIGIPKLMTELKSLIRS